MLPLIPFFFTFRLSLLACSQVLIPAKLVFNLYRKSVGFFSRTYINHDTFRQLTFLVQIIEGTQGDCSFQNMNSIVPSINCEINGHLQRFSAYGFSNDIVLKLIQSLPMNKTSGLDGNYAKLFKGNLHSDKKFTSNQTK